MAMAAAAARSSSLPAAPPRLMVVALLLAALLLSPSAMTVARARPTAVIVFGDSLVDSGNNNWWPTVLRGNFPPYGRDFPGGQATGRFCNGRMPPDYLSEMLGLGRNIVPAYLDPRYSIQDFAIGVNFASAGSGLDDATANAVGVIPLTKQVAMFREYRSRLAQHLGGDKAEAVVNGAVFVINLGSNDFLENYFSLRTSRPVEYSVPQYTSYLVSLARGLLTELHQQGARKVAWVGLEPLGCLPADRARFAGLACDEMHNAVMRSFNAALGAMVAQLRGQLPGADFRVANVYGLLDGVIRDPARYGFTRSDVGCCGTGTFEMGFACTLTGACPDANVYVFWDAAHLTDRTNRMVAEHLMNTTVGAFA